MNWPVVRLNEKPESFEVVGVFECFDIFAVERKKRVYRDSVLGFVLDGRNASC